jgi:hypothetical protein
MKKVRPILFLLILCTASIAVQAKGHGGGHHGGKHCHHGGASSQTTDQPTYAIVQPTQVSPGVKLGILVVQVALAILK